MDIVSSKNRFIKIVNLDVGQCFYPKDVSDMSTMDMEAVHMKCSDNRQKKPSRVVNLSTGSLHSMTDSRMVMPVYAKVSVS